MAGKKQDRRRIGERLGDAGEGVLGTRQRLHRGDPDLAAIGRARYAVGHVAGDPLLAGYDGAQAVARQRLHHRAVGVTEALLHALGAKNFDQGIGGIHDGSP